MSNRQVPWRNKPTPLISQMIPIAKQLKLFLVNEIGPTSLVLKDQNENKFKVIIGSTISCSCNVVKSDHCIHTLFVMLKKFKVAEDHQILWQASYLDSELDGLTQHKYQFKAKQPKLTAKEFLKKKYGRVKKQEDKEDFPPLDEDEMCPICYEDMNGQCYSTCSTCHKSLHTKCFKVWTKHKEQSMTPVTCPMCRTKFVTPMKIIYHDLERWEARFSTHKGTCCKGCGQKNIKGLIYKCLTCPNTDLCKLCYEGNQHSSHRFFAVKQLSTEKWKLAPLRIVKTRKQLFDRIEDVDTKALPEFESAQFVVHLLPTLQQYHQQTAKSSSLGIVGNQMLGKSLCTKCHNAGSDDMLRLGCSHPIHSQCLVSMICSEQYWCEACGQIICPGYWQAMDKKVTKPIKKKNESSCDVKFIRNHQEAELIERKNANNVFSQTGVPTSKKAKIRSSEFKGKSGQRGLSLGIGSMGQQSVSGVNRISGIKTAKQIMSKNMQRPPLNKKSHLQKRKQIESLSIGGMAMGMEANYIMSNIQGETNFGFISSKPLSSNLTSKPSHHPPRIGASNKRLEQRL